MYSASFIFTGLSSIEDRIRSLGTDADYFVIWDRTDPTGAEEQIERFNLDAVQALPYLQARDAYRLGMQPDKSPPQEDSPYHQRSVFEDGEDDERADDDGEEEDAEVGPEHTSEGGIDGTVFKWPPPKPPANRFPHRSTYRNPSHADLLEAACFWLRDVAARNTVGEVKRRFRVRAYAPKGSSSLLSGTFVCNSHGVEVQSTAQDEIVVIPENLTGSKMPAPSFDMAAMSGAAKSVKTLGDLYSQWGHIVLGGVGQVHDINRSMMVMLHRQLTESEKRVEQLVAAILEFRVSQVEAQEKRQTQVQLDDSRTILARDALNQLGEAARSFLALRGITPEMMEAMNLLGTSQELMTALKDPGVKTLMRDPSNLNMLAGMLRQFGQQALAMQAAQNGASAPPAAEAPTQPGPQ